jgi:hypothetical protein
MAQMDFRSAQSALTRVWPLCWQPCLQDGDIMSREGAQQWECPWCRYSLAFWAADAAAAEGYVQDHLLSCHADQLQHMAFAVGTYRLRIPPMVAHSSHARSLSSEHETSRARDVA